MGPKSKNEKRKGALARMALAKGNQNIVCHGSEVRLPFGSLRPTTTRPTTHGSPEYFVTT